MRVYNALNRSSFHTLNRFVSNISMQISRSDNSQVRFVEEDIVPLIDGQIRLSVDRFAITANTVTYATIGEKLGYWDFYPTKDRDNWGYCPAMGWATVTESKVADISCGGRYFGWYPMAKYVNLNAKIRRDGFSDIGSHRSMHAPVYTTFTRTNLDAYYADSSTDGENRQALLRGLFLTSFLADELLRELSYFGAKNVIIVSASSKTALGIAQRIRSRNLEAQDVNLIGLTSSKNTDFVYNTKFYNSVLTYDKVSSKLADICKGDAVVVDMSGNSDILQSIDKVLKRSIKHCMAVGLSHHESYSKTPLSLTYEGAAPKFFFAPSEATRRSKAWGSKEYERRTSDALDMYVKSSYDWMKVGTVHGKEEVKNLWSSAYKGFLDPGVGMIASMFEKID